MHHLQAKNNVHSYLVNSLNQLTLYCLVTAHRQKSDIKGKGIISITADQLKQLNDGNGFTFYYLTVDDLYELSKVKSLAPLSRNGFDFTNQNLNEVTNINSVIIDCIDSDFQSYFFEILQDCENKYYVKVLD